MYLKTTIVRGYDQPLKGEYSSDTVRNASLLEFLGVELMARTERETLLGICKEAFVHFASHHNDKGAAQALKTIFGLVTTTRWTSPHETKLSIAAFAAKRRAEDQSFFKWIEETYWSQSFYIPDSGEEKTNGIAYFYLRNELRETRSDMIAHVADICFSSFDELGKDAFEFLCDCCDTKRFSQRNKKIVDAIKAYADRYHGSESFWFNIPDKDVEMALSHMRSETPIKLEEIALWGEHAKLKNSPKNVRKLLGHAFVNAGGVMF